MINMNHEILTQKSIFIIVIIAIEIEQWFLSTTLRGPFSFLSKKNLFLNIEIFMSKGGPKCSRSNAIKIGMIACRQSLEKA